MGIGNINDRVGRCVVVTAERWIVIEVHVKSYVDRSEI